MNRAAGCTACGEGSLAMFLTSPHSLHPPMEPLQGVVEDEYPVMQLIPEGGREGGEGGRGEREGGRERRERRGWRRRYLLIN